MVVLKMDTSGLLVVHDALCSDSRLPVSIQVVGLVDVGSEWVLARSLLYRSRLLGSHRPFIPMAEATDEV